MYCRQSLQGAADSILSLKGSWAFTAILKIVSPFLQAKIPLILKKAVSRLDAENGEKQVLVNAAPSPDRYKPLCSNSFDFPGNSATQRELLPFYGL